MTRAVLRLISWLVPHALRPRWHDTGEPASNQLVGGSAEGCLDLYLPYPLEALHPVETAAANDTDDS